jgi:hypothetical protein
VFEVNEGLTAPQLDPNCLTRYNSALRFQQQPEDLQRLLLNSDKSTVGGAQLPVGEIDLEMFEPSSCRKCAESCQVSAS